MSDVVEYTMENMVYCGNPDLEELEQINNRSREVALGYVNKQTI